MEVYSQTNQLHPFVNVYLVPPLTNHPYLSVLKPELFVNMVNLNLSSGSGSSQVGGTHHRETNVSEY